MLWVAIYRLLPRTFEAFELDLTMVQWVFLVVFAIFMLVAEGYRGFQKRFSPRTAARLRYLKDNPGLLHVLLAPLFCMVFFYAKRRTIIAVVSLTIGIFLLVVLLRYAPQPWRGLVDFGVILGLSYGILTLTIYSLRALISDDFDYLPEVPD